MTNPPHPGEHLRHYYLEPLGFTVTEAARRLSVSRQALNNLVNGKAAISPEMAIRLAKAFGGRPELWLGLQMQYDLSKALKRSPNLDVPRLRPQAAHG